MPSKCIEEKSVAKSTENQTDTTKKEATKLVNSEVQPSNSSNVHENKEQAPEVSTSTADDVVLQSKPSEDITLILSAEEETEFCPNNTEEKSTEEGKKTPTVEKVKKKKKQTNSLWVSNISKTTKAADLKRLFSENFKVESAKIVTNGKCFFGYISLQRADAVQKAVQALNGFNLAGKTIAVSIIRPDLKATRGSSVVRDVVKRPITGKPEGGCDDRGEDGGSKNHDGDGETDDAPPSKKKKSNRGSVDDNREQDSVATLRTQLDTANSELRIAKRRLREADDRADRESKKRKKLSKEVSRLESQLKEERRAMDKERDEMAKRNKLDELRYEAERDALKKELDECRKLREYLQNRADELKSEMKRRSRTPRGRSPARRSYSMGSRHDSNSRRLYISPPRHRGYGSGPDRQRSPPPPPRIPKRSPLNRSPVSSRNKKPIRADEHSSGGPKGLPVHYPQTNLVGGPDSLRWSSSYKNVHGYGPVDNQNQYLASSQFNGPRDLNYVTFLKGMNGGPRKY